MAQEKKISAEVAPGGGDVTLRVKVTKVDGAFDATGNSKSNTQTSVGG